jgi:hypothetical protein
LTQEPGVFDGTIYENLLYALDYTPPKDEIIKVGLQVAVFEHDNYGGRQLRQDFVDVERVKINTVT